MLSNFGSAYMNKGTCTKTDNYRLPCRMKIICLKRSCCCGIPIGGSVLYWQVYATWKKKWQYYNEIHVCECTESILGILAPWIRKKLIHSISLRLSIFFTRSKNKFVLIIFIAKKYIKLNHFYNNNNLKNNIYYRD